MLLLHILRYVFLTFSYMEILLLSPIYILKFGTKRLFNYYESNHSFRIRPIEIRWAFQFRFENSVLLTIVKSPFSLIVYNGAGTFLV